MTEEKEARKKTMSNRLTCTTQKQPQQSRNSRLYSRQKEGEHVMPALIFARVRVSVSSIGSSRTVIVIFRNGSASRRNGFGLVRAVGEFQ